MHKFALKIIYIEYHIFFLLEIITIYTSKNYNKIVEISLSESLWGNSTYRQSTSPAQAYSGKEQWICKYIGLIDLIDGKANQYTVINILDFVFPRLSKEKQ